MTRIVGGTAGAWRRSAWAAAFALAGSAGARANGAFPDEFSILFQPGAPSRILVGANFGLVISDDDGATWRYSCEPWIVAGSNDPLANVAVSFYQVTADGALLAQSINVTRSADVACTWPTSGGAIQGQPITDIFPSPADPAVVLGTIAVTNGSTVLGSHDGGKTFDPTHLYDADVLTGIEIARSDPTVVYVASVSQVGTSVKLAVSTQSGAPGTWTERPIVAPVGTLPRILAVDPADKDTVYLRLITGSTSDVIAVTHDGGQTFETPSPLSISGRLSAFLRAGDGTVYAATMDGVLYVRPPTGGPFVQRPGNGPRFRCLGQRPGGTRIYACSDILLDGSSLYASDDGARTFSPVMKFTDIQGPLTCAPVASNCAAHWERIQDVLGMGPLADAGQGGGVTPPMVSMSHCSSLGADAATLLLLLTFSLRRGRS